MKSQQRQKLVQNQAEIVPGAAHEVAASSSQDNA